MSHYYRDPLREFLIATVERLAGSKVASDIAELDRTSHMRREELLDYQWRKLKTLLRHVYQYVPYYQKVMDDADITPDDVRSIDDFSRLPILSKKDIRDNLRDLRATGSDKPMKVVTAQTGGTTGEPLKFLRNTDCNSFTRAALLRSYTWTGYRIGDPVLFLTGGSLLAAPQTFQQRMGFGLMNFHFMPGFKLRRETLPEYVDVVRRKEILYLRGYSTLLYQFAALCEEGGVTDVRLNAVYPTAEMLTKAQRDTIERAFDCKIYDHYGCAEVNALANECPEERRMHIIDEHVLMEQHEQDGQSFLVITDLDNYAQPFIRYANADLGIVGTKLCECGRNLTVLEQFLGRSSDAIVLASGERFQGVFFHHLFGHFPGVQHFQVIQDKPGELHVRLVSNISYDNADEAKIKQLIHEHTSIDPTIEYVDTIERGASGKITSVICNV